MASPTNDQLRLIQPGQNSAWRPACRFVGIVPQNASLGPGGSPAPKSLSVLLLDLEQNSVLTNSF